MPLFPFVILSPHTTPAELFREKPVLFRIIIAVTCQHDVELQSRLCSLCRTEIAHRIWDQNEVSLDLLQGILVFIAWRHVHIHLGSTLSSLIHSAIALAVDLDIYHEPRQAAKPRLGALVGSESIGNGELRTFEQRRAQLGLFWLSSVLSSCLGDVAGVKSSSSVANSCRILEQAKECPSDLYLVRLVQLQITAETVIAAIGEEEGSNNLKFSAHAMFDLLEREVKKADPSRLPPIDRSSSILLSLSYDIVRLLLYRSYLDEVSHNMNHDQRAHGISAAARYTSLVFSTVDAAKAVIMDFLSLDSYTLLSLPYPHWTQMGHAIRTLARILTMKSEASESLPAVDLLKLLEQVPTKVEESFSRGMQCPMPRRLPVIFQGFRRTVSDFTRSIGVTPLTHMPPDFVPEQTSQSDSNQLDGMSMGMYEEDEDFMMDLFPDGGFQLNFDPIEILSTHGSLA
ncbi:unnamed protein product [Clonostachys byssicola]|uniref:Transcription factor domain-containing protein n=1 Tax=Clonostachys byssicola TaxID=160290 RepID=A0A9N9U7T6_9HYPO|nr:unnamed protein product [Clonostachys byssicola]